MDLPIPPLVFQNPGAIRPTRMEAQGPVMAERDGRSVPSSMTDSDL